MALAHLGRHVELVGQDARPEHGLAVHVVRQRGGGAEARELDRDVHVVLEARAHAAVARGDAEPEQPRVAQLGVVLEREGGRAVVARGAFGEAGAELAYSANARSRGGATAVTVAAVERLGRRSRRDKVAA